MFRFSRSITRSSAALVLVLTVLAAGCAKTDSNASPESSNNQMAAQSTTATVATTQDNRSNGDAFNAASGHTISLGFDLGDYNAMIEAYSTSQTKNWIEAEVTIDGETYQRAGLRLKGNSSLGGLRGNRGGGPGGSISADSPEGLPWLIRLDKFVDGQNHEGYVDFVVRSNNSSTSLNEAVALELLAKAGLASQEAMATRFSVNGSDEVLRLVIQLPDDDAWQDENFGGKGALYKAKSSGDWSYRGDDAAAYEDVFEQEGGKKTTDLTPLIEFLDFINNSDDETFAAELPEHLDVDAFASYLAMMNLVNNFDDISGPGNNSYLWWDAETEQFTVVPWDLNLAFGAQGFGGGGQGGRGGEMPADGFNRNQMPPAEFNGNQTPPEGFGGGRGGMRSRSNPLVERFHANATFEALYEQKLAELQSQLFDSGMADEILDRWSDVLSTNVTDLVSEEVITSEVNTIRAYFTKQ